jgi:ADP-dependent phosphofructokinase/glucokinase
VSKTVAALTKIFTFSAAHSKQGARSISRIHFHSLKFHIIVQKKDAPFEDPTVALAAGSLIATSQACNFQEYDLPYATENGMYVI